MTQSHTIERHDFEQLLSEHWQLIQLTNDLEYHLYRIGDRPEPERVEACQQSGGALIGLLRHVLFRHDQQVLPILEARLGKDECQQNGSSHPTESGLGSCRPQQTR